MSYTSFRKLVWSHYKKSGRHSLPWRKTRDPYQILVSEVMLQQTQVERMAPFYKNFVKRFPTAKKLAVASLSDVLKAWQGLGYNRRAKLLHQAAKGIVNIQFLSYRRKVVYDAERLIQDLERLPGVGPYTARAVATFAFNTDVIFVETNIRTAIIHHFFSHKKKVNDKEIEKILEKLLPKGKSREWYSALMDYGAHLKKSGVKTNARSKHYAKQSKFTGSKREARGAIMRELAKGPATKSRLLDLLGNDRIPQLTSASFALLSEGLIQKSGRRYRLSD